MKSPYLLPMHSGHRCIVLEEGVNYDSFPRAAERWASTLSLTVGQKLDGLDERIWVCEKNGKNFWLAHDHWSSAISLEPMDGEAATDILAIGRTIGADETG